MKLIALIIGITIGTLILTIYIYKEIKANKETEEMLRRYQLEENMQRAKSLLARTLEEKEEMIKINKKRRNYMFCKHCGAPLKVEKEDCEYCGMYAPYEDSEEESESIAWL